jgi:DNA-binding winged helix-turn-helix (wHTH) protein
VRKLHGLIAPAGHDGFEFDYARNVIFHHNKTIALSPHEADILRVLLNNRARPTPIETLIKRVYGAKEPDAAAISIRVAIHSLRRKLRETGVMITAEPRIGYEIDTSSIPELNRRLADKVLLALNLARSSEEHEVAHHLEKALALAEARRQDWPAESLVSQEGHPCKTPRSDRAAGGSGT